MAACAPFKVIGLDASSTSPIPYRTDSSACVQLNRDCGVDRTAMVSRTAVVCSMCAASAMGKATLLVHATARVTCLIYVRTAAERATLTVHVTARATLRTVTVNTGKLSLLLRDAIQRH
eukprot:SAG11_NODE_835_length_6927_cov_2.877142_6_plen_119_part_00